MENAAKALLIAGGVLITIVVVSIGTYLMKNMGEQTSRFYEIMEMSEVTKFNEQFFKYEGKDLNMQDVVSIMNLARDNNKKSDLISTDERYINIIFKDETGNQITTMNNILESNNYEEEVKNLLYEYIKGRI